MWRILLISCARFEANLGKNKSISMLSTNAFKSSAYVAARFTISSILLASSCIFLLRADASWAPSFARLYSTSTDARYLYFVSCSAIHVFKSAVSLSFCAHNSLYSCASFSASRRCCAHSCCSFSAARFN